MSAKKTIAVSLGATISAVVLLESSAAVRVGHSAPPNTLVAGLNQTTSSTVGVRPVRVLLASSIGRVRIQGKGQQKAGDGHEDQSPPVPFSGEVVIHRTPNGQLLQNDRPSSSTMFRFTPDAGGDESLSLSWNDNNDESLERRYPGIINITSVGESGLEVLNEVDLERYVGCVVANEIWPSFGVESYRAQAIATRTFVLYQMSRRAKASFDVAANQGSQVYRGIRSDEVGERADRAAKDTRGIMCTYSEGGQDRLFCAYFSAACGGMSQSASIFGPEGNVPPLSGGVRCEFCKIAPDSYYRWGPVPMEKAVIASKLSARYPEVADMGGVRTVDVVERTSLGRPLLLRITGVNGATFNLFAERFRLAIDPYRIRSTDFRLRETRNVVIFENGRGFGHGLGLCQWGMEGQARLGKKVGELLRYYYPGSKLTRAY